MGFFFNHGIEYIIVLQDGTEYILVSTDDSDDRLVASQYYEKRKDMWFDRDTILNEFKKKVDAEDFDIPLTSRETELLSTFIRENQNVKNHGWYEVNYGTWTHDIES
jgi:hypothetical protein